MARTKKPLPFIDEDIPQTPYEAEEAVTEIPTEKKLTPSELKDQKIAYLEQENGELKELINRQFEELRLREKQYESMRNFYMKRIRLVTDTITFMKETLMNELKGE